MGNNRSSFAYIAMVLLLASFNGSARAAAGNCNASEACMNEDNAAVCRAKKAECGEAMLIMESCPLQFGCPPTCGPNCTAPNTAVDCNADQACMNEENRADCFAKLAECGDEMLIMESCPLQFGCPGNANSFATTLTALKMMIAIVFAV